MDISISGLNNTITDISKSILTAADKTSDTSQNRNATFEAMLQSAIQMVNETNEYTEQAEEAEMAFALGLTNNTHDLQAAQYKANMSLQYTVAVRNAVMDAYKEIMQMQF